MTRNQILEILRALRPELETRYLVKEISLFGSFARGEQHPTSDIDVLVDFSPEASFFDLVRLAIFLEEKFHCPVDVVPQESLRPEIRDQVLGERVRV